MSLSARIAGPLPANHDAVGNGPLDQVGVALGGLLGEEQLVHGPGDQRLGDRVLALDEEPARLPALCAAQELDSRNDPRSPFVNGSTGRFRNC